jgi:hypothetical protein
MPDIISNRLKWAGFGFLLLLLAVFGWFMIPAHLTSLWMDWEFTDWISPIANRLHGGARLYDQGLHIPMPPLPYILLRVLHPGGAIWIQENFLDYCFRAATLLLLYQLMAKRLGPPLAFAACVATVPVFLSLGKTILYDSMAQFLVAASGGCCASLVESQLQDAPSAGHPLPLRPAVLQGVTLGVLMLTKQSTGTGAFLGVCLTLLALPAEVKFQRRCMNVFIVGLSAAATVCLLSLIFVRFMSFPGMIHDVFLTGTEPKGGPRRMFNNLARYAIYVAKVMAGAGAIFWITMVCRGKFGWRDQWNSLKSVLKFSATEGGKGPNSRGGFMLAAAIASAVCAAAIYMVPANSRIAAIPVELVRIFAPLGLLNLGLSACLALVAAAFIETLRGKPGGLSVHPLGPFVVVYFCAAVFHSLSVRGFRWAWENSPLIIVALAFVFSPLVARLAVIRRHWTSGATVGLLCLCFAVLWCTLFLQFKEVMACTESWPEIHQLAGAKLRPDCEPMRELVRIVRSQADPGTGDTVLMLPDDPNVEAWFDRPRPVLSSAIIFTDQYWDRYVDADFEALRANPPKVIIIGPRDYWRLFSSFWHSNKPEGVIRLIDRVKDELLPRAYDLRFEQRINYRGGTDFMDVYIRKAGASHPGQAGQ